jgi:hypothetical protein
MNKTIIENIKKFNEVKEILAKQGITISDYNFKNKMNALTKDGEFIGYVDPKNGTLEIK